MGYDYKLINGVSLGFDILGSQEIQFIKGAEDARWGISMDFLIVRLLLVFF